VGFSRLAADACDPVVVDAASAPVKEIIETGDDVDIRKLPIVMHSEGDYGPCLTMTLAVKDPESGAYNAAFIKAFYDFEDQRRLRITIHSTDSERALQYYEDRGLPMPVVAILGHHPSFYLGTMGVRMIADPFGDITRQYQAQTLRQVMNVKAVTRRSDAMLQDVFAGHHDHMTVGQIPKEGSLYNTLQAKFGDVITAVHLPLSGCGRLLVYVSVRKTYEGLGKAVALAAIQESWTFQTVVVVDDIVDVYNEEDVVWSALVNVDMSRDVDVIHNIPTVFTTSQGYRKVLIDATRPLDRTIPEMNRVPQEAMDRIDLDDYLAKG
jgi:3-polyprenyl-4-hydroxybenzoate decarboxylase